MIGFLKQVMEVGDDLTSRQIIGRLVDLRGSYNDNNKNTITMKNIPAVRGIPHLLRGYPDSFEELTNPKTNRKYEPIVWRRIS